MSLTSIQKQLQMDHELRSVLKFFFFTFSLLFCSYLISTYAAIFFLITSTPAAFAISRRNNFKFQCTTQAALLGSVLGFALCYSILHNGELSSHFSRYVTLLSIFHFSEYLFTALSNRRSLQPDSFLLNHSVGYWAAAIVSWIEFFIEMNFTPFLKSHTISMIGVSGCLVGEIARKLAMMHAGTGFTHRLAMSKRVDHKLVTNGVYSYLRHPGYFGWFLWAVCTQLVLCNPICTIVYAYVTWHFFSQRIYDEEKDLIAFFGNNYKDYQSQVWSGVPFVKGYSLP